MNIDDLLYNATYVPVGYLFVYAAWVYLRALRAQVRDEASMRMIAWGIVLSFSCAVAPLAYWGVYSWIEWFGTDSKTLQAFYDWRWVLGPFRFGLGLAAFLHLAAAWERQGFTDRWKKQAWLVAGLYAANLLTLLVGKAL